MSESEPAPGSLAARKAVNLERKQLVLAWLNRRWKGARPCPVCQEINWQIDDVGQLPTTSATTDGAQGYPLFPVTCQDCGYSFFINGIVAGIFPREDPPPS